MERLLLAVDGSEHSERAAMLAGELSRCLKTYVDIIHVVPERVARMTGPIHEYAKIEEVYITQRDLMETMGHDVVETATKLVVGAGGHVRKSEVLIGNPAVDIVNYADRWDADVIIMGRRGLGDLQGLFMGSVSHRVGQLSHKTLITTE